MCENVPQWLVEKVRSIGSTVGAANREQVYLDAAGWTIAQYLGFDVSKAAPDSIFENSANPHGTLSARTINRVILVGESLFLLRNCTGFAEFCRRLKTRDFRAALFELVSAKQFFRAGFDLHARPETLVKGDDFDFAATRGTELINVEVTAFTANDYSSNTVVNSLGQKRGQLPPTAPAIICCVIPEQWLKAAIDWDTALTEITSEFFKRTGRINAVVFWGELDLKSSVGSGGAWGLVRKSYFHPSPRFSVVDMTYLVGGKLRSETVREAMATGEGEDALWGSAYSSGFFRWVDSLVPAN